MQWKTVALVKVLLEIVLVTNNTTASPLLDQTTSSDIKANTVNYRLPTNVKPIHYTITLDPLIIEDTDPKTFTGEVIIRVKIIEETKNITLHYNDIDINNILIVRVNDGTYINISYEYDNVTHFCVITSTEAEATFKVNEEYEIRINYEGKHQDDMYGFYRSSYEDENNNTVWLATTQFEPGNARRAFPCFDEPAFKATFNIKIKRKDGRQAISNMPKINDGDPTYDNFQTTPVMSTYLIAFIVSDFVSLDNDTQSFRVWARPGAREQTRYSIEVGPPILHAIEEFLLDLKYSLPKMDEAALPDFSAGAMENWGLTTYRERLILYDKAYATAEDKQRIATVMAHELAHQWFGDLVTPEWWNYLWLNEGFATYFESFAADMVETTWRLKEQFVVRDLQAALAADALSTSHPMTQFVDSPNSIRAIFDTISYEKAGSVIRMMEHFLTTEVFKEGLKRYLQDRKYSNANEDHLYNAINEELMATRPELYLDVAQIMHTWTRQAGYPLLNVTSDTEGQLTITQKRFLLTPTTEEDNSLWTIPLTYTVQDDSFDNTSTKQWMKDSSLTINRPTEENKWFIFNVQQTGYYRVNYDENNWNLLIQYLNSENYENISAVNRAQLLDDALNLARAGVLNYNTALELTRYLKREKDYIPWYSALSAFSFLNLRLTGTETYDLFKEYLLGLIDDIYNELQYNENDDDEHVTKLHRSSILQWACDLDHELCIQTSKNKFNTDSIPANLQRVVYCTALRHGGEEEWNILWDKYVQSNFATEQSTILVALGCTRNQTLIDRYLMKSISNDGDIRRQDSASVFSAVYSSPQGFELALNFLQNKYTDIATFYGTGVSSIVTGIAARITTQEQLNAFKLFVANEDLGAATEAANRAVESATENLEWVEKYGPEIEAWLKYEEVSSTTPSKASLVSLSPVLGMTLFFSILYQTVSRFISH